MITMEDICTEDIPYLREIFINACTIREFIESREIPSWKRFKVIIKLLDADLKDIYSLYKRKKLESIDNVQLRHIIGAMFEPSETREQVLKKIC